jgi:hypothetical protein
MGNDLKSTTKKFIDLDHNNKSQMLILIRVMNRESATIFGHKDEADRYIEHVKFRQSSAEIKQIKIVVKTRIS